jgi:hypothetical protein
MNPFQSIANAIAIGIGICTFIALSWAFLTVLFILG